ncbi:MAG: histidine kinase [Nocardiopsaceae bacterium]|nr:histidine kinase [Nocardiopsaceae bacterium]
MILDGTAGLEGAKAGKGNGPSGAPTARLLALIDTVLDRLGLCGPFARDCLLAVLTALVSLCMLWVILDVVARAEGTTFAPAAAASLAVLTGAQSLVLCVRRRNPLLCLSAVVSTQVAIIAFLPTDSSFQGLAPFIAGYTCGSRLHPRRLPWVLAAATVCHTIGGLLLSSAPFIPSPPPATVDDPLLAGTGLAGTAVLSYVAAALVGNYVATRRDLIHMVQLRATEAIEAQRERANGAIRAERTRMARELHDIAAHHLSGMVIQAAAAERLVGRDEQAAREAVAWIRSQGKETLRDLRLVVNALRGPGEHAHAMGGALHHNGESQMDGAPVPGIAVLDRLVADERALGASIDLVRSGKPYDLPPVADVTFYRVAQEALSNAREHALGAQVDVALHHGESEVVLQVENRPGAERERAGHDLRGVGLIGMRERAQLIGAVLDAGPSESGGWRVRLTLPFTREFSADRVGAGRSEG